MFTLKVATASRELTLPLGRLTDWAKIALGLLATVAPEVLGGSRPMLEAQDAAGFALVAAGAWAILRPRAQAPQWFAMAASGALVLWPSVMEPTSLAAPWTGILLGFLGGALATATLRQIKRMPKA